MMKLNSYENSHEKGFLGQEIVFSQILTSIIAYY